MEPDLIAIHGKFPAAAEYLSGIYIINRDYGYVTNVKLAEWMGVTRSAVSQAIGRLKRLGLARQRRYENVVLTESGRATAVQVLRHHYLLEHLLVRMLGYPWDLADEEAKRLQTQISEGLADHLYERLGAPQTCPHGNPMPGSKVEKGLLAAPALEQALPDSAVTILRITEEGEGIPGMLKTCNNFGVRPGARFEVVSKGEKTINLKPTKNGRSGSFSLPMSLAEHIRYRASR